MAIKDLLNKYQEQWRYLIVGCCTTLINYVLYFLLNLFDVHYIVSNVLAWAGAVVFAYFANGAWVYRATSRRSIREATAFVASRVFSLGLETVLLALMVEMLGCGEYVAKIIVGVVVVVVNYLTGLLVYKKGV
ncbi:MAG: GtrA family protein [Peptococcaceae bacterium]|nr:GtrA family protein [Peptococcaceae bacterium]